MMGPARGVTWGMGSLNLPPLTLLAPQVNLSAVTMAMSTLVVAKLQNLEEFIKNIEVQLVAE
jgi:hypothetical protein